MALTAAVSLHSDRDEHLWLEELAGVRARRHTLTPVAAAAVESVLRSILGERARDEALASTLAALAEARGALHAGHTVDQVAWSGVSRATSTWTASCGGSASVAASPRWCARNGLR